MSPPVSNLGFGTAHWICSNGLLKLLLNFTDSKPKADKWQVQNAQWKAQTDTSLGISEHFQGVIAATALPKQRLLLPNHQHQIRQVEMITIPAGSASTP